MRATKTTKDTAQGIDKIPYSMLHHLSPSNKRALLRLFNTLVIPRNSALSLEKHQHPNNTQRGQHLCFSTSLSSLLHWKIYETCCAPSITTYHHLSIHTFLPMKKGQAQEITLLFSSSCPLATTAWSFFWTLRQPSSLPTMM